MAADSSSSSDANSPQKSNGSSGQDSSPIATRAIESELIKALQDLDRGERAASSLEDDLSRLEARLDDILAGLDPEVIKALDDAAEAPPPAQEPQPEPMAKDDEGEK